LSFVILLFADDMVLIGKSVEELQTSLTNLFNYCEKWGLEVNTEKTKTMVFRKRGPIKNTEKWSYNNIELQNVDNFNYLGVVLNYTGGFQLNSQHVVGKAVKAQNVLLLNVNKYDVTPRIALQLFDAFVSATLNYSCAVWGFCKSNDIERVHLKYCKSVLGVKQSTCTAAVYSELGRYPIYIQQYVQIIKFWLHILYSENAVIKTAYYTSLDLHEKGYKSWASRLHTLLNDYGFSDVWANPFKYSLNEFVQIFKRRTIDCFLQKLRADINSSALLNHLYIHLTDSFEPALYLDKLFNKTYRRAFSRLRLSSHGLRIETDRYGSDRLPRE